MFCSGSFNMSYRCKQSHNKLYNWHADSSCRSIVHLSRERTTPRISSWTFLKYYIHLSFILKLVIFIYKQLKRPVAFSVVQMRSSQPSGQRDRLHFAGNRNHRWKYQTCCRLIWRHQGWFSDMASAVSEKPINPKLPHLGRLALCI